MAASKLKVFYSKKFLEHDTGWGHPECAARLMVILDRLKERKLDFSLEEPRSAIRKDLELIHDPLYLGELSNPSRIKTYFPDNPIDENTFEIALLAAGAAYDAAKSALKDKFAFALIRPPGHHASWDSFGGFCYLNNLAFAVAKLLQEGAAGRVLIVDFDVHHGNGTQDIFYNNDNVFYLSFHQKAGSIYPYRGFESENNAYTRNVEFDLFINDEAYLKLFEFQFKKAVLEFQPGLVAVSAGFDLLAEDIVCGTVTNIRNPETFYKIGLIIKKNAKCPVFGVLEGGYFLEKLGDSVCEFLRAFEVKKKRKKAKRGKAKELPKRSGKKGRKKRGKK